MQTFWQWVARIRLLAETYITFNPKQYDCFYDEELKKVIARTTTPRNPLKLLR